ncbi:MAG: hypothetical protein HY097_04880 [Nitrospinae bacterium]|nr:hypothetical protein [Nitrospinota bacterium]MBI3814571.1 hypothetical protein [Nitrospinota bacterium]
MEKLDGKELKLKYLNERKGNEEHAIQFVEQIDKLWAIPYLIGQYHALMTLTNDYPSNIAHLNNRMWAIEHVLCIIAKYGSENAGRQSSSIIDSFLDATDGYLSAAMHEQNTEYCEGSLFPDGKLRYEFMMHKDKDFQVYREYVMRLFEYNHRESILPKDDVLKIFKNEFAALDELVAKCAGNTVEQIVEFVDRYVFAQIERF